MSSLRVMQESLRVLMTAVVGATRGSLIMMFLTLAAAFILPTGNAHAAANCPSVTESAIVSATTFTARQFFSSPFQCGFASSQSIGALGNALTSSSGVVRLAMNLRGAGTTGFDLAFDTAISNISINGTVNGVPTAPTNAGSSLFQYQTLTATDSLNATVTFTFSSRNFTLVLSKPAGDGVNDGFTLNASTITGPPVTSLSIVSGNNQSTTPETAFANPFVVSATDANGLTVPFAILTYTISGISTRIPADSNGQTSFAVPGTFVPSVAGSHPLTVSTDDGPATIAFATTVIAGPPTNFLTVSGNGQSTNVLTAFADPLSIQLFDAFNNRVPGVTVSWDPPATGASAILSSPTVVTDANGVASITAIANGLAGVNYPVRARFAGAVGTFNVIYSLTNIGAPEINITGNGQSIVDGDVAPSVGDHTDFGNSDIAGGTVSRTFTIENVGSDTLTLGANAASLSGANAADFAITSQPATTVAPGASTSVTVQFDPSALGARTATLTIANDDGDEAPYDFTLSGTGVVTPLPEINVTGNGVGIVDGDVTPQVGDNTDFGNSDIVAGTASRTFTIQNTGTGVLTLGANSASLSGVNTGDFSITSQPATTVTGAGSTSVTVQFDPSALGARTATLTIANDDSDESPYDFTVSGTGTGTPEINVTGNTVSIADGDATPVEADHTDFGSADITSGTVSRSFTIQNTGTDILTLGATAASLSGAHAGDFVVTNQPATTVAPGASTSVTVQFDPSSLGARAAVLTIVNDDADESPYDFALAGEGISGGTVTIVQNITGADVGVGFSSATPALNFTLTSVSGTAQTSLVGVPAGAHTLVADDLSAIGYGVSSIACNDTDSSGDVVNRTANINLASGEQVTCVFETVDTRGPTTQMIADFLGARNTLILANQPGNDRRINRLKGGSGVSGGDSFQAFGHNLRSPLPVDVAINEDSFSFATSLKRVIAAGGQASLAANANGDNDEETSPLDIWIEGSASRFIDGTSGGGSFGLLSFGVDYLIKPDILIGLVGQIDRFKQDFTTPGSEIEGRGWMVGPYATLKLDEHLYLDVLGTWGRSDNDISPFGTYTDTFETDRWLISSALTGQFDLGHWAVQPSYTLQFFHERQFAYTDSLGVRIPEQSLSQGDMRLGPQVAYTHTFEDGSQLRPKGGFEGVYSFGERDTFSPGSFAAESQGLTGQINGGLDYQTPDGLSFGLAADYGGIGGTAKSFGATINLAMPLN